MPSIDAVELFQPETLQLIDSLSGVDDSRDLVALVSALRKDGHPTGRIHQALEQVRLRRRAQDKFGAYAERMLFTEEGLEQATRLAVAAHHAGRMKAAGIQRIIDGGCGIGGDAMAFAGLGLDVTAMDKDTTTAAIASYNLAPFPSVTVTQGAIEDAELSTADGLWLDPARRDSSSKRLSPDKWSPPLNWALDVAQTIPTGLKLAPGLDHRHIPPDGEAQWVSYRGSVAELVYWSGPLARPGISRSALLVGDKKTVEMTGAGAAVDQPVGPLGAYIHEPDGAVIRAQLIGDLARELGGSMVSKDIAYITGDSEVTSAFAQTFAIDTVLPLKEKDIQKWLRQEGIGVLEIKKRGVDIDPATFRHTLRLEGEKQATLIVTRVDGVRSAIMAHRIS